MIEDYVMGFSGKRNKNGGRDANDVHSGPILCNHCLDQIWKIPWLIGTTTTCCYFFFIFTVPFSLLAFHSSHQAAGLLVIMVTVSKIVSVQRTRSPYFDQGNSREDAVCCRSLALQRLAGRSSISLLHLYKPSSSSFYKHWFVHKIPFKPADYPSHPIHQYYTPPPPTMTWYQSVLPIDWEGSSGRTLHLSVSKCGSLGWFSML